MRGQIMKGIAGFYFVKSGETIYRCKARGLFKKQGIKPAVGDEVIIEAAEGEDDSLITEILPRRNSFIRPFVANADCFVIVTAPAHPAPVLSVIDKLLVMAEQAGTEAVLCVNKCDLAEGEKKTAVKARQTMEELRRIYEPLYPVICTRMDEEGGLEPLRAAIRGKTVALAGASGVGKSTLLNRLLDRQEMETGQISHRSRRGRHTTRHAELFPADEQGTMIFDTPGFTSFDMPQLEPEELPALFPEIAALSEGCRYDDCTHRAEPDCAVKDALEEGRIEKSRYESYRAFRREAEERRKY